MSEFATTTVATGRSGIQIFASLCLINAAMWFLIHGSEYLLGALLLVVSYLLDKIWSRVSRKFTHTADLKKQMASVLQDQTTQQVETDDNVSQNESTKTFENTEGPIEKNETRPENQIYNDADDFWDKVYLDCVEQKKKAGTKAQTRRRRG
ncbi:hypothetical protein FKW77_009830 [Venturia effusa]|uniref:Uncharacterized protein n=1 Tax=Venturia effusa TaxID=50376 RepID=A0A517L864_9PEZI|nr:hypothetical protein FKW77_009830 [Venturia effusa]